jgi:hypothetical protein
MPRRGASITQADIARALRAAQAAGPKWYVEILPGGIIRLVQGETSPQSTTAEQEAPIVRKRKWRL